MTALDINFYLKIISSVIWILILASLLQHAYFAYKNKGLKPVEGKKKKSLPRIIMGIIFSLIMTFYSIFLLLAK